MSQFPEDFNGNNFSDVPGNGFKPSELEMEIDRDWDSNSRQNILETKKKLQHIFLILLGIGLAIGTLVSIGVVAVMNKLKLKEIPKPVERQEVPVKRE
jgi:hypothetical protein